MRRRLEQCPVPLLEPDLDEPLRRAAHERDEERLLVLEVVDLPGAAFVGPAIGATIPFYAFAEFDSARIAGLFYTAGGAGGLLGSLAAMLVVKHVAPLRMAGLGMIAATLPLWLLPLGSPAWGVMGRLFCVMGRLFLMMLFIPFVDGPVIGLITARTPVELRPKVMTALVSVSTLSAPLGFLAAGRLLGVWAPTRVFGALRSG